MGGKVGRKYMRSKILKTKSFFNKEEIFNINKYKKGQIEYRLKRRHWVCQLGSH